MLTRIGVLAIIIIVATIEAAIVSVMKDNSKKMRNPTKAFHRWLIIWAAVNTTIIIVSIYLSTGTLIGVKI
jgi:hypothetical protein